MSDALFGKVAKVAIAVVAWSAAIASVGTAFYILCAAITGGLKLIS